MSAVSTMFRLLVSILNNQWKLNIQPGCQLQWTLFERTFIRHCARLDSRDLHFSYVEQC